MKRFIITTAALLLVTVSTACDEPVEDGAELRAADIDPVAEDAESVACPPDGAYSNGNNPGFPVGWVEYWTTDPGQCNGRGAIRGYCPSSMGGTTFNNLCGCGCVWDDDGGMQ